MRLRGLLLLLSDLMLTTSCSNSSLLSADLNTDKKYLEVALETLYFNENNCKKQLENVYKGFTNVLDKPVFGKKTLFDWQEKLVKSGLTKYTLWS